jgi:DNA polymerase III epsilon subunit-like protein
VFDSETTSLLPDCRFIQLAAIAVAPDWSEIETFEVKIQFDEAVADPKALEVNHYDPIVWVMQAVPERQALTEFADFLGRHKSVEMVSKRTGRPYSVARLAGHNAATFDGPRLFEAFRRHNMFCPAHPQVLCTLSRAMWFAIETGTKFESLKLSYLAEFFGVHVENAHDALADCKMAIGVAKALGMKPVTFSDDGW